MVRRNKFSSLFVLAGLGIFLASCQTQVPPNEEPTSLRVEIGLIALEDNGVTGEAVGCGDSVIAVEQEIKAPVGNSDQERIQGALEALFAIEGQTYGESGLYNALYQSDLKVESILPDEENEEEVFIIAITGTMMSGGICDDPRIVAQIQKTVEANAPEDMEMAITINGKDLDHYFDMK